MPTPKGRTAKEAREQARIEQEQLEHSRVQTAMRYRELLSQFCERLQPLDRFACQAIEYDLRLDPSRANIAVAAAVGAYGALIDNAATVRTNARQLAEKMERVANGNPDPFNSGWNNSGEARWTAADVDMAIARWDASRSTANDAFRHAAPWLDADGFDSFDTALAARLGRRSAESAGE